MLTIHNHSDSLLIVIHEIYGINRHMEYVCQALSEYGYDVICPNLLDRAEPYGYAQEEEAYRHFIYSNGFAKASYRIKTILADNKDTYRHIVVIGFSVGATIAWMCSGETGVHGIVGYYGSRIRDYLDISPQCTALLFFPQEEASFSVGQLISNLEVKDKVEVFQFDGQHGFGDPFSAKYNEQSAKQAFDRTVAMLQHIRNGAGESPYTKAVLLSSVEYEDR